MSDYQDDINNDIDQYLRNQKGHQTYGAPGCYGKLWCLFFWVLGMLFCVYIGFGAWGYLENIPTDKPEKLTQPTVIDGS